MIKKSGVFMILSFSLMSTSVFALQSSVSFIDELSSGDHVKVESVAQHILDNKSSGIDLFDLFNTQNGKAVFDSFTIQDLVDDVDFFNDSMAAMVVNGDKKDALKSFLNLLGFGGKHFTKDVDVAAALSQYLPEVHVRTVNGVKNIFFANPAFTDGQFAENISYYDSLSGLEHLVPACVSNQKKHDQLLAYAFLGKGVSSNVNGLSKRGHKGARLPIVELMGKFLAKKLAGNIGHDEKVVFSGSGFAGAVAQEVAYQLKKKEESADFKVVTTQAMRYLAGDFAADYATVLGENNVFSINTSRRRSFEVAGLNYKSIYFKALGEQVRLDTDAPTNGFFDGIAWKLGLNKDRYDENHKGVLFKTKDTPQDKVGKILGKTVPSTHISDRDFARLAPIMVDVAKGQTQASSNALATLIAKDMFLKTSSGRAEHDNLVKIREMFKIQGNTPTLVELADKTKVVVPASYYDPIHDVTLTVAHAAGNKSAHDSLKNILGQKDFTGAAKERGVRLGKILAALHEKTGRICHGDFHLNNIRFDSDGNAYVIDVETLAKGVIDGNHRDPNGFKDILDLIAKTTSHLYKSDTYGASKGFWGLFAKKASQAEKSFAKGVLMGYVNSLDQESLGQVQKQYSEFKKNYGSNINKFLSGGFFSTYNNAIFGEVFKGETFEHVLEERGKDLRKLEIGHLKRLSQSTAF